MATFAQMLLTRSTTTIINHNSIVIVHARVTHSHHRQGNSNILYVVDVARACKKERREEGKNDKRSSELIPYVKTKTIMARTTATTLSTSANSNNNATFTPTKVSHLFTVSKQLGGCAFLTIWLQRVLLDPFKTERIEMVRLFFVVLFFS